MLKKTLNTIKNLQNSRKIGDKLVSRPKVIMQAKGSQKKLKKHCKKIIKNFPAISIYRRYNPQNKRNQKKLATVKLYQFNKYPKGINYLSDNLDFDKTSDNTGKQGDNTIWRKYILSIIKVDKQLEEKDMKESTNKKTVWNIKKETTRYYISTTAIPTAEQFNKIIRKHWEIENSNHGVRDNTLEEDKSRIRKNPSAMARIRSLVINILGFMEKTNIQQILVQNSCSKRFFKDYRFLW